MENWRRGRSNLLPISCLERLVSRRSRCALSRGWLCCRHVSKFGWKSSRGWADPCWMECFERKVSKPSGCALSSGIGLVSWRWPLVLSSSFVELLVSNRSWLHKVVGCIAHGIMDDLLDGPCSPVGAPLFRSVARLGGSTQLMNSNNFVWLVSVLNGQLEVLSGCLIAWFHAIAQQCWPIFSWE